MIEMESQIAELKSLLKDQYLHNEILNKELLSTKIQSIMMLSIIVMRQKYMPFLMKILEKTK